MMSLKSDVIFNAYRAGTFPMAQGKDDPNIVWVSPEYRGVIPLTSFHISNSLQNFIFKQKYQIKINTNFSKVIKYCADRDETWISKKITECYIDLHKQGHCHSVEVWDQQELVGGVYGLAIKKAFFGESMFSKRSNTSKIALAYLVSRLKYGGFSLLDVQFLTNHLASLGAIEIKKSNYQELLKVALQGEADFLLQPLQVTPQEVCT